METGPALHTDWPFRTEPTLTLNELQVMGRDSLRSHTELAGEGKEKWTHCHPFLTQHSTNTLPFLFILKRLTVKKDEENTSGNRQTDLYFYRHARTRNTHKTLCVETSPAPCLQFHIPVQLCHWNPLWAAAATAHLILTRLWDDHRESTRTGWWWQHHCTPCFSVYLFSLRPFFLPWSFLP